MSGSLRTTGRSVSSWRTNREGRHCVRKSTSHVFRAALVAGYCDSATNTGNVPFVMHDQVDDRLGTIRDDFVFDLGPDETLTFVSDPVVIDAAVTNVATWTASTIDLETEANGLVESGAVTTVTATGTATVILEAIQPIAFTGSNTAPMLVLALALIAGGYLALTTARRGDRA